MGEFRSGQWIVLLLVYFTLYFILAFSLINLKASVYATDPDVHITDPGFTNFDSTMDTYLRYGGKCDKPGDIKRPVDGWYSFLISQNCSDAGAYNYNTCGIDCEDLDSNNNTCSFINGCSWVNDSIIFGQVWREGRCDGLVNISLYGISDGHYCNAVGLQGEAVCKTFKCSWSNSSELYNEAVSIQKPYKSVSMLTETVKFMAGFRTDFGFKQFGWIFAMFFTFIPGLMLIFALYMSMPFLH